MSEDSAKEGLDSGHGDSSRVNETVSLTPAGGEGDSTVQSSQVESAPKHSEDVPAHIGRYEIVRIIASGGMGTVYEAEQQSPKRTVALKVIRQGKTSPVLLKRFELESQVLGRLQHPGIAQIYEAGFAETEQERQPFFAMEFVRGVDLRRYVNEEKLDTRARLDLIARVCDAVHHAHQKGVIHRDLKPGNILVDTSGRPKILDFGVARATDSDMQVTTMQTDVGQLIGTIQYMSPEQVSADPNEIDTRSDIYSLGVIAFEILTGRPPYDLKNKMIHEAARIIREEELTRLSTINRTLRGDIETIVGKTLEKEKERRYQSAAELAEDLRRYLHDDPILARPPSALYQLQKFAKRNRALTAGIVSTFVVLVAGIVGTTAYARSERLQRERADELARLEALQRKQAENARDESEAVTNFLTDTLSAADPKKHGKDVLVRDVLDAAAPQIDSEFDDRPLIRARLHYVIGWTYRELGDRSKARAHLADSAAIYVRENGPENPDSLRAANILGVVVMDHAEYTAAEAQLISTWETQRRVLGEEHTDTLNSMHNVALLYWGQGRYDEAEELFLKTLDTRKRILGPEHPDTLQVMNNLGILYRNQARYDEAERVHNKTLGIQTRILGEEHPDTISSMNNLGALYATQGRFDLAKPAFVKAWELSKKTLGTEHVKTLSTMANVALLQHRLGHDDEAERLHLQLLEIQKRVLGEEYRDTLRTMNNLASLYRRQDRFDEAEPLLLEGLDIQKRVLGDNHPDTIESMHNAALLYRDQERYDKAEPLVAHAIAGARGRLAEDHPELAMLRGTHGSVLLELERFRDAEGALLDAHRVLDAMPDRVEDAQQIAEMFVETYESLNAAEPGKGYDDKAAEWREKLSAMEPADAPELPTR